MATFLDVSGLEHFASFFVFLFVWLVVYALLQSTAVIGKNQGINVIIGLIIGLLVLFSPIATGVIQYVSPWFGVVFIFAIFAILALKIMGATNADMASSNIKAIVGIVVILIFIVGALSYIRDEMTLPGENETSVDYSKSTSIIFHPTILGAVFILIIAVFAIALLAAKQR